MKIGSKQYDRWFKSAAGARTLDEISNADRVWFEQHPNRKFRLRDSIFSEMDTPASSNMVWKTLVMVVEPGFRIRTSMEIDISKSNFDEDNDEHLLILAKQVFPKKILEYANQL